MRRLATVIAALLLAAGTGAGPASAHEGGRAQPRIAAGVSGAGLVQVVTVRVTDLDGGGPVSGAAVVAQAEMTSPHLMRTAPWSLAEQSPGLYRARVRFVMPGTWTVEVRASGEGVADASARLEVPVRPGSEAATGGTGPALTLLPTRLEETITHRDVAAMAVLWVHGLAAVGWILGVLAMALALSARPGILAEGVRARFAVAYRRWGALLHWSFVPVVVGTGVYNMLYVTPFPIAWRPSQIESLADIPFGPLYEAILIVKLGLFAALLVTGTQVLLRTVRLPAEASAPSPEAGFVRTLGAALGPAGIFYLACVPLILAAAVALRYVHILSHVAEVVSSG